MKQEGLPLEARRMLKRRMTGKRRENTFEIKEGMKREDSQF